jgi:antitoxin MazE
MIVSVVSIGNSKGIRLPKHVLDGLGIEGKLELEVVGNGIVLTPVKENPREGWESAFAEMHRLGEDELLDAPLVAEEGLEWEW